MQNKLINLKNKKILLLGGHGLIGSKLAEQFIYFQSNVTVLDINEKPKVKINKNYKFHMFDCTDFKVFEKKFIEILNKYEPDVFINCSYPFTHSWKFNTFKDIKFDYFVENINNQLNSSIWLTKLAADFMKRKKIKGSIINVGSIYGLKAQDKNLYKKKSNELNFTYSAIKGSMINFTRQAAAYYGANNIRINNIIAGGVKGHIAGKQKIQDNNFIKNYEKKTPLQRMANSDDISGPIIFLSSDLSKYITGSNLVVDGGHTII